MTRTRSTLICGLSALALLTATPVVSQGAPAQPPAAAAQPAPAGGQPPAAAPVQPQPANPTHVHRVAAAEDLASLHAQLEMQGYSDIVVRRTLLGRYRVQAENAVHVRELVIHQRTGEILRDVILEIKGDATTAVAGAGNPTAGGVSAPSASADVGVDAGVSVDVGGDGGVSVGGSVGGALGLGN